MLFSVVHRAPLRRQLMWAFAALSLGSTAIATLTVASVASRRLHQDLHAKSVQYARQLQRQLEPVIAFDDHISAQEAFESLSVDGDVAGLAVYGENGDILEGRGRRPDTLTSIQNRFPLDAQNIIALGDIQSRNGRKGRVFVDLSSESIDVLARRNAMVAAGIAAAVALGALVLGATISKRIALRLERIGEAAKRMAAGDHHVALEDAAEDSIGDLAQAFNAMVHQLDTLAAQHQRQVATEHERLEQLVLERTLALEQSREMFRLIAESTHAVPFTLNLTLGSFPYIGTQGMANFQIPEAQWVEPNVLDRALPRATHAELRHLLETRVSGPFEFLSAIQFPDDRPAEVRWMGTCETTPQGTILRGLMQDVTEMRRLARELTAAQKLESVGRLAAGVAHEINTPIQFVADNVEFVTSSMASMSAVIAAYRKLKEAVASGIDAASAAAGANDTESAQDIDYILENTPPALAGAKEGLQRIASIVHSMKEFSHPDQAIKSAVDLNRAIESTLVIARNEYKYVAEVQTDLVPLPAVHCYLGQINQVLLNLLVNAAHAIEDVVKVSGARGLLTVRTRVCAEEVEISITDTGTGIPLLAQEKIFDPFFTTKEVGKGTGQGLAIAWNFIVNQHGGSLRFETELGKGTTFLIRLPIGAAKSAAPLAA